VRLTGSVLYHRFVWFVICAFIFSSTPDVELAVSGLGELLSRLAVSEALAGEAEGVTDEVRPAVKETPDTGESTRAKKGRPRPKPRPHPSRHRHHHRTAAAVPSPVL
jgi:hypothetical protein